MCTESYRIVPLKKKAKYTLFFASYLFYERNSTTKRFLKNTKKLILNINIINYNIFYSLIRQNYKYFICN